MNTYISSFSWYIEGWQHAASFLHAGISWVRAALFRKDLLPSPAWLIWLYCLRVEAFEFEIPVIIPSDLFPLIVSYHCYNKLWCLKQHSFVLAQFQRSEVCSGSAALSCFWRLQGGSISLPFLVPRSDLYALAHGLFLHLHRDG
jgi:hypothetical protein